MSFFHKFINEFDRVVTSYILHLSHHFTVKIPYEQILSFFVISQKIWFFFLLCNKFSNSCCLFQHLNIVKLIPWECVKIKLFCLVVMINSDKGVKIWDKIVMLPLKFIFIWNNWLSNLFWIQIVLFHKLDNLYFFQLKIRMKYKHLLLFILLLKVLIQC